MNRRSRNRVTAVLTVLLALGLLTGWKLQFWLPSGTPVLLLIKHFPGLDCEIWQRKNAETLEPFATGLFVHDTANDKWTAYCLDIQDVYEPSYSLRDEGSDIYIPRGRKSVYTYNLATRTLKKAHSDEAINGTPIASKPPGNWWTP